MKFDANFEVHCKHCGAIFMSKQSEIPATLQCTCQGNDFGINQLA